MPRSLLHALGVALLGALLLFLHAPRFHLDRLHVEDLNDQVGYITTAKDWVETGTLSSHLIYPTYLDREKFRFYMPGHYAVLALAYVAFGDSPFVWRLPGMLGFLLTSVAVFLAANRIRGPAAGWIAAVLFWALPATLGLSFTANSEPTTTAAVALAVLAFLYLPERHRVWSTPALLVVPFLFRETTSVVVILLVALIASGGGRERRRAAALALLASFVVLSGLYAWQIAEGKTPPPAPWSAEGDPDYATFTGEGPMPVTSYRPDVLVLNFARNTRALVLNATDLFLRRWQPTGVLFLLVLHAIALYGGLRYRPRDGFAVGAGLTGFVSLITLLTFHHTGTAHVTLRHLSWTHPLGCVAVGCLASRLAGARLSRRTARLAATVGLVLLGTLHVIGVERVAERIVSVEVPEWTRRIERLGHDDDTMLVSSAGIALDYVLKHYPVGWAFVPEDEETLVALGRRYELGTIIVQRSLLRVTLGQPALERQGYERIDTITDPKHGKFLVFRRPESLRRR